MIQYLSKTNLQSATFRMAPFLFVLVAVASTVLSLKYLPHPYIWTGCVWMAALGYQLATLSGTSWRIVLSISAAVLALLVREMGTAVIERIERKRKGDASL